MKLKIKTISLSNFKGIKNKELNFDSDKVLIKGQNGAGKTTIGSALSWIISDCDLELNKNPLVTPLGESECTTKVEAKLEIDGKPLTIAKIQRYKEHTDDDGKTTSGITNSYEINGIAKSMKAFISDLEDRGINVTDFMVLTNPNQFTSDNSKKGREQMREILFAMADDISDEDLAKELGLDDIIALLEEGYKLEEIEMMSKSNIKKITEINGKDNEIINGKIEGIIASKSKLDKDDLEKQKAEYEKELSEIRAAIKNITSADNKKREAINQLEENLRELKAKQSEEFDKDYENLKKHLREVENLHSENQENIKAEELSLEASKKQLESYEDSLSNYRDLYMKVQDETLDENSTLCPTCHREYDQERIKEIKDDFIKGKTERLNEYKKKAEDIKSSISMLEAKISGSETFLEKSKKELEDLGKNIETINSKIEALEKPNFEASKEYKKIKEDIAIIEAEIAESTDDKVKDLEQKENYAESMLRQVIGELAVIDRDKELDEQINKLRQERKDGEINKAKAEKTLDQVNRLKNLKDDKLSESINSKFSLVEWHLWEAQRNGERKAICEPYVDGKPMSSCANGSLRTLAKVSICADIQRSQDVAYPIIIEDYSLFSNNTMKRIEVGDSQLIGLVVSEDKEITLEG